MGVGPTIDLTAAERRTVVSLLERHLPNTEAWVYGSRARWTARPNSDLDMVVFTTPEQARQVGDLREALEESTLPFPVDMFVWDEIPEEFHAQIETEHAVLTEKDERPRTPCSDCIAKPDGNTSKVAPWRDLLFDAAVLVNPPVSLKRGNAYPHVDMALLTPGNRSVRAITRREFRGGGSRFEPGDTLMARITPCLENGKTARFELSPDEYGPAHGSTEFIVLRGREAVTDTSYVYYLARSPEVRDFAISQMTGTSGRQRVPPDCFHHFSVSIPPIVEQRAIAHVLSTLDDKIDLNRRMNETLEAMAQALFKSWFVDFDPVRAKVEGRDTTLSDELARLFPERLVATDQGVVPHGWEVRPLGQLIELAYGKALRAKDRKGGVVPVYGSNGQVGWHDTPLIEGPGIVVGRKGNPGVVKWAHTDFFPIDTTFYVKPIGGCLSLPFVFYALVEQNLGALRSDSAVPGLNRNLAYLSRQLVPSGAVLQAFEEHANELFTRIHRLTEESRTLVEIRDALLPRLVSGDIRLSTHDGESVRIDG